MYASPIVLIFSSPSSSTNRSNAEKTSSRSPTSCRRRDRRRHRREVGDIGEQDRCRWHVVGDRGRSILEADDDRIRKDVVEQVVGSLLEPVALLHEVPDDREGHDGGRDQVERRVGGLVTQRVSLPGAWGHHREPHRADEDKEPSDRGPDAGRQQCRERDREAEHHDQAGLEQAAEQRGLGELADGDACEHQRQQQVEPSRPPAHREQDADRDHGEGEAGETDPRVAGGEVGDDLRDRQDRRDDERHQEDAATASFRLRLALDLADPHDRLEDPSQERCRSHRGGSYRLECC